MLIDYQSASDKCKARALNGVKSYHYLFFIGTSPEARGQGLASQVVRNKQVQARQEGVPIWLEATTERSRRVYEKCGFETVGSFVLGKGNFAADGEREVGGPGAEVWAMLWKTEKSETVESNGGS
jgi:ribosomal protein S18 acetylase RimI-like enzyme